VVVLLSREIDQLWKWVYSDDVFVIQYVGNEEAKGKVKLGPYLCDDRTHVHLEVILAVTLNSEYQS
jgi:hypothetical protein